MPADELAAVVAERVPGAQPGRGGDPGRTGRRAVVPADLDPGSAASLQTVPEGEGAKSLATVEALCRGSPATASARSDVVVAVGGGVVTDVAGFAAAAYHRGMAYVNVATSLLAQVDAAVGGKTGVNLPEGKNLVGAFWQPSAVLCDTATLATLPPREWASGRGEMAKYAFLGGGPPDASLLSIPLDEQVARCVAIKAAVVAADEREGGAAWSSTTATPWPTPWRRPRFGRRPRRRSAPRRGGGRRPGLRRPAGPTARADRRRPGGAPPQGGGGLRPPAPTCRPGRPRGPVAFMGRDKKASHDLTFVLDGPDGVEPVRGVDPADALATLAEMRTRDAVRDDRVLLCCRGRTSTCWASASPRSTARPPWTTTWPWPPRPAGGPGSRSSTSSPTTRAPDRRRPRRPGPLRGRGGQCRGLSHTSWSLHDALAAFDGVVVELHLSNPAAREPFRHTSVMAPVADGYDRRLRRPRLRPGHGGGRPPAGGRGGGR